MKLSLTFICIIFCFCQALALSPTQRRARPARLTDVGVDIGIVRSATYLFQSPDSSATKVGHLRVGSQTVLVSRSGLGGWLNVIQSSTGHQGWVLANRLMIRLTRHKSKGFRFEDEALGTIESPELRISNSSDKTVFTHIGQRSEFAVAPHGTQSITVNSGIYEYNAVAANVIPLFGSCAFSNGSRYSWTFYISHNSNLNSHRPVNPALIAESAKLQAEIDRQSIWLKSAKGQLENDRGALEDLRNKYKMDCNGLDSKRQTLDRTNQAEVDEFNVLVDAVNAENQSIIEKQGLLNSLINLYNTKLASTNKLRARLSQIENYINSRN